MQHSRRAQPALARLPEVDPAIAALSLWCSYRDSREPTATEGETIRIGPEFPLLPISEQTGLIAHHVLHVALRHSARRSAAAERFGPSFHSDMYDLACDALVNEALLLSGHALPRPAVRAAELVEKLPLQERPDNVLADWDCDRLYAALKMHCRRQSGSQNSDIARYMQAQGFEPDLRGSEPDGVDAGVWFGRVSQAMAVGQRAGSGIGAILTRFGHLPKATVPWEVRLRRLLAKATALAPQMSHRRPSRSWLARDAIAREAGTAQPVFEPAVVGDQKRPRLVIALDTSSSVKEAELDLFAAEAVSVARRTGAEAHLWGFDTEVHSKTLLTGVATLGGVEMRRDGGTDYAPVLEAAQRLDPSMLIVLTDLDAPTDFATVVPVLWAVPRAPEIRPAFGDVLVMVDQ